MNSGLVFPEVVKQHALTIVRAALVSALASPLASEPQDLVIFESALRCDAIHAVLVAHSQSGVIVDNHLLQHFAGRSNSPALLTSLSVSLARSESPFDGEY